MAVIALKSGNSNLKENLLAIFKELNYSPKGRIFIKPNFSGRPPLIPGENSDPEFIKILAETLLENGAQEIIIGHGGLLGTADRKYPFEQIIEGGGFEFLKKLAGVRLLNLDEDPKEEIKSDLLTFHIPQILKKVDSYINLAKVKAHMEATVSFALKNQMGLIAMEDRINMHRTNLESTISQLGKITKPDLNIIDGIIAMEGNGPHHGQPKELNLLVAGTDMVETDSLLCELLSIDAQSVAHITEAEKIGAGQMATNEIKQKFAQLKVSDFKPALRYEKFGKNIYVWPTTSCSRCITALNESGKLIKKNPLKHLNLVRKIFFGNKKINLVIGKAHNLNLPKEEKIICFGHCSKEFADKSQLGCLDKCPPAVGEAMQYLIKKTR